METDIDFTKPYNVKLHKKRCYSNYNPYFDKRSFSQYELDFIKNFCMNNGIPYNFRMPWIIYDTVHKSPGCYFPKYYETQFKKLAVAACFFVSKLSIDEYDIEYDKSEITWLINEFKFIYN